MNSEIDWLSSNIILRFKGSINAKDISDVNEIIFISKVKISGFRSQA